MDLVKDDEFSDADWDQSREAVNALVKAMRDDLEADRKGTKRVHVKKVANTQPAATDASTGTL